LGFVKEAVEKNIYEKSITDIYSDEELLEAEKFINPDFDMDFDYAGMTMLINRYLLQDLGKAFELPQEMFLTISLLIASVENTNFSEADCASPHKYIPATSYAPETNPFFEVELILGPVSLYHHKSLNHFHYL
jgi:ribonucleotide reductase alpha subunit